ncbi:hypothetical protein fugu_012710 [Takifugu bimaculatus]|uniref:PDZ domain-containing protein n=1 Tax=Takifugu bimaculatus TaxID=433685 RepID=A0A4Z2C639_9TELE|nr:hypothetical protein fugu_012710 [Takifugu bimaculatus]
MSGDKSISESLVLDDSDKGVIIKGITDDGIAAKSGLKAGDEIVAATVHLDHLNKTDVLKILKVLEPYDDNMKVLTKKELGFDGGLGSLGVDPAQVNLKKDLSGTAPIISFDGQHGKLDTDISSPAINGNLPNLSVNKPSLNVGSQFSKPSFGVTGPEVQGGLGDSLKVSTPQLNTTTASLDVKNPDVKTGSLKFERPKFSMPNFNLPQMTPNTQAELSADADLPKLETQNLSLDPNVDIKGPKAGFTGPNFNMNGSGVNIQTPNVDTDGQLGKFKWPHQKWKVPKAKGLEADLSTPDLNASTPGVNANIDTPGVNLNAPRVDIRGPGLDAPNVEADPPSGKITWPHLKWKKPKGPSTDLDLEGNLNTTQVSVPNLQSEMNATDIDINVPKAELKGPNVDMQSPNVNMEAPSGKINWPHLKWKKPRGSRADLDLDPDLNLSTPNISGEINTTNSGLKLPKAGLNSGVDVQMPDADIDTPSGKINWPHLKWKKPNIHGPKADLDLNPDLSSPDVDVSLPNVNAPDVDLNLPHSNVDVKAPNLNVDPPSGKFKWPTLKKSKIKNIDQNLDLGADVSVPDPALNGPDVNLSLPKANMEAPKIDLDSPDIEGPSGKFKWFNFKKPKFGTLNGPKADFDTDVKAPDMALGGPDVGLKTTDINLSSPNIEGNSDLNVRMPNINPNGPDVELPDGKLNLPQWKLPNLRGPKVGAPELNADVNAPDIDANTTFGAPNLSLSAPNVTPDLKGVDLKGDLSAPDLSLSTPNVGGINASGVNLNMPKTDLEGPKLDLDAQDIDGPSGKFKWFNFKKPKIGTLKGGKADIDAEMNPPHLDLAGPNGNISLPDIDVDLPKAQLNGPSTQLQTPDIASDPQLGDLKLPHFKHPQLQNPTVHSGIEGPNVDMTDLTPRNVEGSIPTANIDTKAPTLNVNPTNATFKSPEIDTGAPTGALADVILKAPPSVPEVKANVGKEDADAKQSPQSKLRWPFKWGFNSGSGTDEEGSGVDSDTEASNAEVPAFKFHQLPKMNLDGIPEIGDTFGLSKQDTETKEYIVSKGIRLPIVNATSKPGEKISILERLQMAKENTAMEKSKSADSTLERGGTFKLEQPASVLGLKTPEGSATNGDKLSLGLSNMLGLNVKGSD